MRKPRAALVAPVGFLLGVHNSVDGKVGARSEGFGAIIALKIPTPIGNPGMLRGVQFHTLESRG